MYTLSPVDAERINGILGISAEEFQQRVSKKYNNKSIELYNIHANYIFSWFITVNGLKYTIQSSIDVKCDKDWLAAAETLYAPHLFRGTDRFDNNTRLFFEQASDSHTKMCSNILNLLNVYLTPIKSVEEFYSALTHCVAVCCSDYTFGERQEVKYLTAKIVEKDVYIEYCEDFFYCDIGDFNFTIKSFENLKDYELERPEVHYAIDEGQDLVETESYILLNIDAISEHIISVLNTVFNHKL